MNREGDPHAIAVQIPWARKDWFSSPAQRNDGRDSSASSIPYGARFALPATFDVAAYTLARQKTVPAYKLYALDLAIIAAWTTTGSSPTIRPAGGVRLSAEQSKGGRARNATTVDPYAGTDFKGLMLRLPFEKLQMLQLDLRRRP